MKFFSDTVFVVWARWLVWL